MVETEGFFVEDGQFLRPDQIMMGRLLLCRRYQSKLSSMSINLTREGGRLINELNIGK